MLIFVDLETTGLDPEVCAVLEVCAIATDDAFVEIARFTAVVHRAAGTRGINPYVVDMHTKNGLWEACAMSEISIRDTDRLLAAVITEARTGAGVTPGEKTGPQLAGNTISFDRAFLRVWFPRSYALLHYRNLDVTTLNEMARRFWPEVHAARPKSGNAHRAEADCVESLETARYYARTLGPVVP